MDNLKLKPGDKVVMHSCEEATKHNGRIWEVTEGPNVIGLTEVVWLRNYKGCFATTYLQRVDVSNYEDEIHDLKKDKSFYLKAYTEKVMQEEVRGWRVV